MKSRIVMPALAIAMFFSGCSKFDLKWFHQHSPGLCTVEQFNSSYMNPAVSPYLFKKTYNVSGVVNALDAYVLGVFYGERHFKFHIKRSGLNVYFVDQASGDTLMRTTLNIFGRPVSAREMPEFYQGQPPLASPMRYEFQYKSNRLVKLTAIRTDFTTVDTAIYDSVGNLLSFGPLNIPDPPDRYEYDYLRTAKQQFYMDIEFYGSFLPGFRLLEYLDGFPELTSARNLRMNHTNAEFSVFKLSGHMFDAQNKLTAYKGGDRQFSIIWKCKQ